MKKEKNIAFIDGQNLFFGTTKCNQCAEKQNKKLSDMKITDCVCGTAWNIDLKKFRIFLKDKYHIDKVYYYLGFIDDTHNTLYTKIQENGYILQFRKHTKNMISKKKGNVDINIVFNIMKKLIDEPEKFDKIMLISGDGDYNETVDYLIQKGRFLKILFPDGKRYSSLYNELGNQYFDILDKPHIQAKISNNKTT